MPAVFAVLAKLDAGFVSSVEVIERHQCKHECCPGATLLFNKACFEDFFRRRRRLMHAFCVNLGATLQFLAKSFFPT
jgi:hypothetical protein